MLAQVQVFRSKLMLYMLGILSFASAAIVGLLQPYKVKAHNNMDSILMMLMGIYFISFHEMLVLIKVEQGRQWFAPTVFLEAAIWIVTLVLISLMIRKPFCQIVQAMIKKIKAVRNHGDDNNSIEYLDRDYGNYPPLLG